MHAGIYCSVFALLLLERGVYADEDSYRNDNLEDNDTDYTSCHI